MFKVNNKDTRTTPMVLLLTGVLLSYYFTPYSSVSVVNFEHVIVNWVYSSELELLERIEINRNGLTQNGLKKGPLNEFIFACLFIPKLWKYCNVYHLSNKSTKNDSLLVTVFCTSCFQWK